MATFETLQQEVKELLGFPVTTASSTEGPAGINDQIKRHLNDAMREWHGRIASFRPDLRDARTTLSYTASTEAVALPAAAQLRPIVLVEAASSGASDALERYALEQKTTPEFEEYDNYGEPLVWALEGTSIMVRPIPQTTTTLYIRYVAALTSMSATSDTPSWLPDEYHHGLAWHAAAKYKLKRGDPDWSAMMSEADRIRDEATTFMYRMAPNNHIRSSDRYA